MRSNDVMLGFGYDIFSFTMLQEMMAIELGVELGWYQHVVGSLHAYERDRKRIEDISSEAVLREPPEMGPMTDLTAIDAVLQHERVLRERGETSIPSGLPLYWRQILVVLRLYRLRREGQFDAAAIAAEELRDSPYAVLLPGDSTVVAMR